MRIYLKVLAAAAVLMLNACGGGTTGTGDTRSASFNGRVLTSANLALPEAEVTILESGDSSTTDADGAFSIQTELSGDSATILVRSGDKEGRTLVKDIPEGDAKINLEIQINVISGNIEVISIQVNPIETPVPDPAPEQTPGGSNTPSPDSTPIPAGTPNPDSTPNPDKAGESVLEGMLLFADNIPVQGAFIQFAAVNGRTNSNGKFSVKFKSFNGASLLQISKDKIKSELKLDGFKKSKDVRVILQLKLAIPSRSQAGTSTNQLIDVTVEKQTIKVNN